jgi:hypothetical protein
MDTVKRQRRDTPKAQSLVSHVSPARLIEMQTDFFTELVPSLHAALITAPKPLGGPQDEKRAIAGIALNEHDGNALLQGPLSRSELFGADPVAIKWTPIRRGNR